MLHRMLVLAALVMAPLASNPASVAAQERGLDRATAASANAQAANANSNAQATGRPTTLPPGVANVFAGRTLPPGIALTRNAPAPQSESNDPAPEPEPEPDTSTEPPPEECQSEIVIVDGAFWIKDCNGNLTPLLGM